MHTARYRVDHLNFEHTMLGVGSQLAQCPGVLHVDVDRRTSLVAIDYDERTVSPSRLERMICDCGYECRGDDSSA